MERITFDQLPEMVAIILDKLAKIEGYLSGAKEEIPVIKEMLTATEAANFMGVSKSTLYKLSHNRAIPLYKPTGGRIYFKRVDIIDYLQTNRVMSLEEIERQATNFITKSVTAKRKAQRFR